MDWRNIRDDCLAEYILALGLDSRSELQDDDGPSVDELMNRHARISTVLIAKYRARLGFRTGATKHVRRFREHLDGSLEAIRLVGSWDVDTVQSRLLHVSRQVHDQYATLSMEEKLVQSHSDQVATALHALDDDWKVFAQADAEYRQFVAVGHQAADTQLANAQHLVCNAQQTVADVQAVNVDCRHVCADTRDQLTQWAAAREEAKRRMKKAKRKALYRGLALAVCLAFTGWGLTALASSASSSTAMATALSKVGAGCTATAKKMVLSQLVSALPVPAGLRPLVHAAITVATNGASPSDLSPGEFIQETVQTALPWYAATLVPGAGGAALSAVLQTTHTQGLLINPPTLVQSAAAGAAQHVVHQVAPPMLAAAAGAALQHRFVTPTDHVWSAAAGAAIVQPLERPLIKTFGAAGQVAAESINQAVVNVIHGCGAPSVRQLTSTTGPCALSSSSSPSSPPSTTNPTKPTATPLANDLNLSRSSLMPVAATMALGMTRRGKPNTKAPTKPVRWRDRVRQHTKTVWNKAKPALHRAARAVRPKAAFKWAAKTSAWVALGYTLTTATVDNKLHWKPPLHVKVVDKLLGKTLGTKYKAARAAAENVYHHWDKALPGSNSGMGRRPAEPGVRPPRPPGKQSHRPRVAGDGAGAGNNRWKPSNLKQTVRKWGRNVVRTCKKPDTWIKVGKYAKYVTARIVFQQALDQLAEYNERRRPRGNNEHVTRRILSGVGYVPGWVGYGATAVEAAVELGEAAGHFHDQWTRPS